MVKRDLIPIDEKHVDEAIDHHRGRASIGQITERVVEKEQDSLDTGILSDLSVFQLVKTRVNAVLTTGKRHGRYLNSKDTWKRRKKTS